MTEPTPTTPTKRKRRQAMSDEGRQILQRERQRIAREQAVLGERLLAEARRNERQQERIESKGRPEAAAVQRGMVKRIAAVLVSEGVNARLDVAPSTWGVQAYTDYRSIVVRYKEEEDKRLLAAVLRGLMYHEGGHIRWTLPYPQLKDQLPADFVYPVDSEGNTNHTRLHRAWNGLEDQRMETAVTSDSPRKAAYLTPMVMTVLTPTPDAAVANWPLLIWRRYLPRKIRVAARAGFVAQHGEALARQFEAVVDSYIKATDAVTVMNAVIAYANLLDQVKVAFDLSDSETGHGQHPWRPSKDEQGEPIPFDFEIPISPEMDDEDEEEEEEGDIVVVVPTDSDDDEAEEAEGDFDFPLPLDGGEDADDDIEGDMPAPSGTPEDGDDDDDDEAPGEGASGGDAPADHTTPQPEPLTQDDINEAIADAEATRDADDALDEDVEAYHQALEDAVTELAPYVAGFDPDEVAAFEAEMLAEEIERAFQAATMDRAPAWNEHQRRGIVNVGRYTVAMQQPTPEMDFYRDWVEDDQPGYNTAVSLMLDYSSSMSRYTKQLGQTAYAVKLACQRLGIPCTVTLWDHDATVLWDANEVAEGLPLINSAGATNPSVALADLDNQRFEKVNHIVLIMTDGEWQDDWEAKHNRRAGQQATLAYHAHDRVIVGFGFSSHEASAKRYQRNLEQYGCSEAFGITNLMEIPERLQEILIALA